MANRRMFTLQIVDSDAFLDMPISTQLLYFHLAMRADDDGFIGNPKKIMRIVGANEDDMKVMLAKRFILTFESSIIVVKHWKMHNYIQNDRYKPTQYVEEKKLLSTKENGSYTDRIHNVSSLDAQVRLGKVRLGKVRLGKVRLGKVRLGKVRDTNGGAKAPVILTKKQTQAIAFMGWWNRMFNKNYSDAEVIEKNLEYWLGKYSPRDIALAAVNMKKDGYWKNIVDPYKFLRQKNPRGERVDRIGEFLNAAPPPAAQGGMVW